MPKTDPYEIALTAHEVEQLIAIDIHGIVASGDTISHQTVKALKEFDLVRWADGGYQLTFKGQKWVDVLQTVRRMPQRWSK